MRTASWVTMLALTVSVLVSGGCRQNGGEEGGLEVDEDTLQIEVEDDLEGAGRDAREAVEGALERGERAVGEAMQETGRAIGDAAEETGAAVDRAMEKTGEKIERAGRELTEEDPEASDSL